MDKETGYNGNHARCFLRGALKTSATMLTPYTHLCWVLPSAYRVVNVPGLGDGRRHCHLSACNFLAGCSFDAGFPQAHSFTSCIIECNWSCASSMHRNLIESSVAVAVS
jgi:hypothetical protein